ncbi:translation initiation factor [Salinibius halmophilus]|uniref:translation initiation factor n=1 Tax=Salinibius halmophilus TaxID=1853216 RepID=UPI001314D5CD|nr:translation initiation factor [Salinibius halmophilus]
MGNKLVWSSEFGGDVRKDEEVEEGLIEGPAHVRRETKARGGKTVVTIGNLALDKSEKAALCKRLKKRCGTGGTVKKEGHIEIQGNVLDAVLDELKKADIPAKQVGG